MSKAELFILIPGRTSRQGTAPNEGKFTAAYVEETSTLLMNPDDMTRLQLKNGDRVRLRSEQGEVELPCQAAKAGELPPGLLFLPYGDQSSRLMGGDRHGTGMPNSKEAIHEISRRKTRNHTNICLWSFFVWFRVFLREISWIALGAITNERTERCQRRDWREDS
jgi:formylmethanofuran dehydrogenase subunit D